jgi:two-component system, LuxR family, sensor kinase FixL
MPHAARPEAEAVEVSLEFLSRLGQAALDPIIVSDARGCIAYWNDRCTECFGWAREDVLGKRIHDLLIPKRLVPHHLSSFAKSIVIEGPPPKRYVTHALRRDGTEFMVELSIIHMTIGSARFPFCFVRDIDAEKRHEAKLREADDKLAYLARLNAMATMASALAHEMAQPLGAAQNFLSIALMERDHPAHEALLDCRSALGEAAQSLASIRGLVRKGGAVPDVVALDEVLNDVLRVLSAQSQSHVRFEMGSCAHLVWADRIHVEQVLTNLLRNATEALQSRTDGQVAVTAETQGEQLVVAVDDNGPGIPEERWPTLFEAFRSTKSENMGMGLALSRVLVERCGGRLWIEHKNGSGARFCFTLPRKTIMTAPAGGTS